jgi:hypothetical protein
MLGFVGQYPLRGNNQRPPGGSLQSSAESRSAAADCFAMATGHSDAGVHRLSQRALTSPSKTKGSSRTVRCACATSSASKVISPPSGRQTARPVASQPQVSPVGRVPWRDVSIRICLLEDGVFALRLAGESRGLRPFCVITGGPGAGPRPGASGRGCWVQLSSIRIRRRSMNRRRCAGAAARAHGRHLLPGCERAGGHQVPGSGVGAVRAGHSGQHDEQLGRHALLAVRSRCRSRRRGAAAGLRRARTRKSRCRARRAACGSRPAAARAAARRG